MSGGSLVYLDHNATTPPRPEVVETVARVLRDVFGNPSSVHDAGRAARRELDAARERVAALVGAAPESVVFTGSATEANNAVLHGVLGGRPGVHAVATTVEHPSVDEPLQALEARGLRVSRVPVGRDGRVDPEAVAAALRAETALVSVILANNETGVLQDVAKIREAVATAGVPLHVDATQAVGKVPVDVAALGADLLTASAHKLNGPKGVGFLVATGRTLEPFVRGGPQERRRRGGTENVAGIAGLGVAAELARADLAERPRRDAALRDRLWEGLRARVPRVRRNGSAVHVLPNTLNAVFEGAAGDVLLEALDLEGIAVSAGAACASGSTTPSHVLLAMGLMPDEARASLRFSVGLGTRDADVDRVLEVLPPLVARVRDVAA